MIISHVKIIAFQLSLFCKNYRFSKTVLYIINRKIHGCLEIPDLFLVLNMISHSFAALTRWISCSTLEINLVFPRTHVLFSMYLFVKIFYQGKTLRFQYVIMRCDVTPVIFAYETKLNILQRKQVTKIL